MTEHILTVKIVCTKDTVEIDGQKMSMPVWAYSTIKSNGDYDNAGIVDVLIGCDEEDDDD